LFPSFGTITEIIFLREKKTKYRRLTGIDRWV